MNPRARWATPSPSPSASVSHSPSPPSRQLISRLEQWRWSTHADTRTTDSIAVSPLSTQVRGDTLRHTTNNVSADEHVAAFANGLTYGLATPSAVHHTASRTSLVERPSSTPPQRRRAWSEGFARGIFRQNSSSALVTQDSASTLSSASETSADSSLAQDGWQTPGVYPPPFPPLLALLNNCVRTPGQKDRHLARKLLHQAHLEPRRKDLSVVTASTGHRFLMTPSVALNDQDRGAFGKLRLALDTQGRLVAVKEIRTPEAYYLSLDRHGSAHRELEMHRPYLTRRSAFLFEVATMSLVGDLDRSRALTRIRGKILNFQTYFRGGSLTRLFQGPPSVSAVLALRVLQDVSEDLDRLSRLFVVHRDVRPSNILWDTHGFFLNDFGSARPLSGEGVVEETDATYFPPEIFLDTPRVDRRADAWALGMTIMSLVPGREPSVLPASFFELKGDALDDAIEEFEEWRSLYQSAPNRALERPTQTMSTITRHCHAFFSDRSLFAPQAVDIAVRYLLAADVTQRSQDFREVSRRAQQALAQQTSMALEGFEQFLAQRVSRSQTSAAYLWQRRLFEARPFWLEETSQQTHHSAADTRSQRAGE